MPVAVTVTEGDANNPHAGMMGAPQPEQKPVLVVVGDATLASNYFLQESQTQFDLLASMLDWLRERTTSIGIPPKDRSFYVLAPNTSPWTMTWVPTLLMFVGIVGLGTGVWVVRRR